MFRNTLARGFALALTISIAVIVEHTPAQSLGSVSGRVIDATSGQPIDGARVFVTRGGRDVGPPPISAVTTAGGAFTINSLPRGTYGLRAELTGYANGWYGVLRPGGSSLPLVISTEPIRDVVVKIWKAATIRGSVTDESGRPIVGASVELRSRRLRGSGTLLGIPAPTLTDVRGTYEFARLTPGDYMISVLFTPTSIPVPVFTAYRDAMSRRTEGGQALIQRLSGSGIAIPIRPPAIIGLHTYEVVGANGPAPVPAAPTDDGKIFVFQTTFYPNALQVADAESVHVDAGEVKGGIDFRLAVRPTFRVSGTVTGPDGPSAHYGLRLVTPDEPAAETTENIQVTTFEVAQTITDTRGAFTFLGVPAGRYLLKTAPGGGSPWVRVAVEVGKADLTDLAVEMHPGLRVHGRITFEGTDAPPSPDELRRTGLARLAPLVPAGFGSGSLGVQPKEDGTFVTEPYEPGLYMVLPTGLGRWQLESAILDGRDISAVPLELTDRDLTGLAITYSTRQNIVRGTVDPGPNFMALDIEVIAFPADYQTWMRQGLPSHLPSRTTRTARLDSRGAFVMTGLATGEYLLAAYKAQDGEPLGAGFLQRIASVATRVSHKYGEITAATLKVVDIR